MCAVGYGVSAGAPPPQRTQLRPGSVPVLAGQADHKLLAAESRHQRIVLAQRLLHEVGPGVQSGEAVALAALAQPPIPDPRQPRCHCPGLHARKPILLGPGHSTHGCLERVRLRTT